MGLEAVASPQRYPSLRFGPCYSTSAFSERCLTSRNFDHERNLIWQQAYPQVLEELNLFRLRPRFFRSGQCTTSGKQDVEKQVHRICECMCLCMCIHVHEHMHEYTYPHIHICMDRPETQMHVDACTSVHARMPTDRPNKQVDRRADRQIVSGRQTPILLMI